MECSAMMEYLNHTPHPLHHRRVGRKWEPKHPHSLGPVTTQMSARSRCRKPTEFTHHYEPSRKISSLNLFLQKQEAVFEDGLETRMCGCCRNGSRTLTICPCQVDWAWTSLTLVSEFSFIKWKVYNWQTHKSKFISALRSEVWIQ